MAAAERKPCYICWFFTISLAIVAGTLLSDAIRVGIAHLSADKNSSSIVQNTNKPDSNESKKPAAAKAEGEEEELPVVKLSPKNKIPTTVTPSANSNSANKDLYINVLPENKSAKKVVPKEEMPGYQTTLEICNYWKKEYEKEATKQNSVYMEAACNRLKTYQ